MRANSSDARPLVPYLRAKRFTGEYRARKAYRKGFEGTDDVSAEVFEQDAANDAVGTQPMKYWPIEAGALGNARIYVQWVVVA